MPRKMRTPKVRHKDVNPYVYEYLLEGDLPDRSEGTAGWFECFTLTDHRHPDALRAIWQVVQEDVLNAWRQEHPGTRPWAWWRFDAPRWRGPYPGRAAALAAQLVTTTAEPRRRLGGIGTPAYEVLNVWASFAFGIPTVWVSVWDEEYRTGRRKDVDFSRIHAAWRPTGSFDGLAPRREDPPIFEAQATYLDRLGLLSAAERRRADFAPEVLTVDENDQRTT